MQERRQELQKRARELDIREGLIADAEKRVESKLMQIKESQQPGDGSAAEGRK